MANIVEKYPFVGNTGQCLILNPREKLVYPFNLGSYSEVRVGMFYSFTSGVGDNVPLDGNDAAVQNSPYNQGYFGFCNYSTGSKLPGQSGGYDFVGFFGYGGNQPNGLYVSAPDAYYFGGASAGSPTNWKCGATTTTGGYSPLSIDANGAEIYMKSSNSPTGATSFAGMLGMQLSMSGSNAVRFRAFSNNTTYSSDVSTSALRNAISSMGAVTSTVITGFYTSGHTSTAERMMTPDAFLLYMPMLNRRIRIHNLVVERYA